VIVTTILMPVFGGLLALCAASLATHMGLRLADRMPGESYWPDCLYCQRPAKLVEMLPLFGWLLRPRAVRLPCPCARQTRQWAVPLAEMVGLLAGLAAGYLGGAHGSTLLVCLTVGLLPAIAVVDVLFGIIPNSFNLLLGLLGLAWLLCGGGELTLGLMLAGILLLLGLLLAYGYSWLRGKDMLGLGDVKFFAAAGLWLQLGTLVWFLMLAGFVGALNGLVWKKLMGSDQSPFAPALCLSLLGCILYQLAQSSP
jgi:prepilin signal peptidase PulO-like enzyme (type II secretory pathway)